MDTEQTRELRAYWIKTTSSFDLQSSFKNDGSAYLLWDAVAVSKGTSGIASKIRETLKESDLTLKEISITPVEVQMWKNEIPERIDAMYRAAHEAAFMAVTFNNDRDCFISWSAWTMTAAQLESYNKPNKKLAYMMLVKSKVSPQCSLAFDGSTHHYKQLLVPADTRNEAELLAEKYENDDYCEIEEILFCEAWKEHEDVFDIYDFSHVDSQLVDKTLRHGNVTSFTSISSEAMNLRRE